MQLPVSSLPSAEVGSPPGHSASYRLREADAPEQEAESELSAHLGHTGP